MHLTEALSRAALKITQQLLESQLNSDHRVTITHSTRHTSRENTSLNISTSANLIKFTIKTQIYPIINISSLLKLLNLKITQHQYLLTAKLLHAHPLLLQPYNRQQNIHRHLYYACKLMYIGNIYKNPLEQFRTSNAHNAYHRGFRWRRSKCHSPTYLYAITGQPRSNTCSLNKT